MKEIQFLLSKFAKNLTNILYNKKLSNQQKLPSDKSLAKFLGPRKPSTVAVRPTNEYEIVEIIEGLNVNKSPGFINTP